MSYRSDRLKGAGWKQRNARMWTVDWLPHDVDILTAEKMQNQADAGAHIDLCPSCGWPTSEVVKTGKGGQQAVRCYDCRTTWIAPPEKER